MDIRFSLDEIQQAAAQFVKEMGDAKVFALYAAMGVGKTTFTKAVCECLGVLSTVNSPTFAIINEYRSPQMPVYHFDFYRLKQAAEAMDIGAEDYFYSGAYCFIEWPEKIEGLLPDDCVEVHIEALPGGVRHLWTV